MVVNNVTKKEGTMAYMQPYHALSVDSIPVPAAIIDVKGQTFIEENEEWKGLTLQEDNLLQKILVEKNCSIRLNHYTYTVKRKQVDETKELVMIVPEACGEKHISLDYSNNSRSAIYESLIYNTPTCVCILDNKGKVVEMNQSFQELFQISDAVLGESLCNQTPLQNPSFITLVMNGIRGVNTTGEEVTFMMNKERKITCNITISPANYKSDGTVDSVGIILHDITEKKNYENELVSLKAELENTLRLQKTITYKINKKGNEFVIEMAAGELLKKLNLTPSKVIGKTIEEVFDSHHLGKIQPKLKRIWETGEELTYEDEYKDLEYIASIVPVVQDGMVVEIICSISDISLIKDIQRKLIESEQKYKSIVKYSPDNIYMVDTNGIIQEVNPAVNKQWNHISPYMIGSHFSDFIAEGSRHTAVNHFEVALKGEASRFVTTFENGEGGKSHVAVTNIPIRVKNKVIGIYGFGQDITEKMKMEEELKEAKELLEAYFEHAGDGIVLLDPEGSVLKVNQQFESMFGWNKDEITGHKITFIHQEDQVGQFKQNLMTIKAGKRIKDYETVRYRKDGTPIEIAFNMNPILNDDGNLIGISAIIRDLSEKKRNEDLLKKSEQLAMIGQLAAGVAHEIRNPLTTLKGFLQLMKENAKDDFYLGVIQGELDRIEIITNEFLALAKPRAVQFSLTSLTTLLTSSVEFIKMECLKQGVDVRFSVEEAEIYCDSHQMKQVILNVMKNALEAMPSGGLLSVQLEKEDGYAKISIQDNGNGIPPERMKHLGEPFYSTKEKGTGLGLMICQKIIKEHHGSLSIQSNVTEGTTVTILLPIVNEK
ncbi:PAS domain S-box protein [Rossellomorea aquimaris]|uniref:PAS domain-containing protein n=1 Tax=Rossellomorea aquimaris TaxID=189382 RepID=UPI0011E94B9B|nr:PAS domain S-box protein [Rossellomorea aquimaris]TYS90187.1 PAS domain S-box protein [Rossellomorea aquimaris]